MISALATAALLAAGPGAAVEVSYGAERLTGGRPSWRAASVEGSLTTGAGRSASLAVRELERYGDWDVELALGGGTPLGERWHLSADASAALRSPFAPQAAAGALAAFEAGRGVVLSGGLRASRYDTAVGRSEVLLGSGGVEWYAGRWRLGWTGFAATLDGAWAGSQRLAADLYYGEQDRAGLALVAGREVESGGAAGPILTDVRGAALLGRHRVAAGWSVVWELSAFRHGDLFTRTRARLGLRREL